MIKKMKTTDNVTFCQICDTNISIGEKHFIAGVLYDESIIVVCKTCILKAAKEIGND